MTRAEEMINELEDEGYVISHVRYADNTVVDISMVGYDYGTNNIVAIEVVAVDKYEANGYEVEGLETEWVEVK